MRNIDDKFSHLCLSVVDKIGRAIDGGTRNVPFLQLPVYLPFAQILEVAGNHLIDALDMPPSINRLFPVGTGEFDWIAQPLEKALPTTDL